MISFAIPNDLPSTETQLEIAVVVLGKPDGHLDSRIGELVPRAYAPAAELKAVA